MNETIPLLLFSLDKSADTPCMVVTGGGQTHNFILLLIISRKNYSIVRQDSSMKIFIKSYVHSHLLKVITFMLTEHVPPYCTPLSSVSCEAPTRR